jgi:hypothetical protein
MTILYQEVDYAKYRAQTKGMQAMRYVERTWSHLDKARTLCHRCSAETLAAITNPWAPLDLVYLPGRDARKWFSIGKPYVFTKALKEEAGYFNATLEVPITGPLRDWFRENLIYEKIPPTYATKEATKNFLEYNPCCKREGDDSKSSEEKITIGIPRAAFLDLLFMADFFSSETEAEAGPAKTKSELTEAYRLMKEAHHDPQPIVTLMRERHIEIPD